MSSSPEANLATILTGSAARHPQRAAIRLDERVLSFADLDLASSRVSEYLRLCGIEPGARVGLMLPNAPEFAVLYYGILRAGGVVVPMNPLLKAREVAYHLADAQASGVLAWHSVIGEAAEGASRAGVASVAIDPGTFTDKLSTYRATPGVAPRDPGDTAVILSTSGTTGRP